MQRLGLTTRPVQRQHQLSADALAQGMLTHESVELADQLVLATEREIGVDPNLQRRQTRLLQPGDLSLSERLVGEVSQRRPPPQPQRIAQEAGGGRGISPGQRLAALDGQTLELVGIELTRRQLELIATAPGVHHAITQRPAQMKDITLERLGGSRGRSLAPQLVDQPLAGYHLTAVQEQDRKHRALLSTAQ